MVTRSKKDSTEGDARKPLPKFEGKQVARARITMPGLSGGFNDGLDVDPIALKHGQVGVGAFRWEVRDVDHPRLKKDDPTILVREHILIVPTVMIVHDEENGLVLEAMLDAHADYVKRGKQSMAGQGGLDLEHPPDPSIPDDELSEDELAIRRMLRGEK